MYITVVEIEQKGIITGYYETGDEACLNVKAYIKKMESDVPGLEHDFEVIKQDFPEARCYKIMGNLFYPDGMSMISDGVCSIIVIDLKDSVNGIELFIRGRENTSLNMDDSGFETVFEKYSIEFPIFSN